MLSSTTNMGDNSATVDICSDEDRKPPLSELNATPQASSRTVVISPEPDFGPKRPMPSHLADILKEWHQLNGRKVPPCAYRNSKGAVMGWKVFDREGKQLELSKFVVVKPCSYSVLVLHQLNAPEKLVRSRLPHGTGHGSFLIAWLGVTEGYEARCCAIRVFAPAPKEATYSQGAWKVNIPDLDPEGEGLKKTGSSSATTPQPRAREQEKEREKRKRESHRRRAAAASGANIRNVSESVYETDSSAEECLDATSSSSEEEDEEGDIVVSTSKRRRVQHQPPAVSAKIPKATKPTKVTLKLVSYKSGAIRAFPLDECKTGKDLFNKAQTFFRLFDRHVEVKILSCQISSERTQHYLFDGNEGEFDLLIEHAKGIKNTDDGTVIIEVNNVLEL